MKGVSYDDVSLVPQHSKVLPRATSVKTRFTKKIGLGVPLVSAAMDTVTEAGMAIALAYEGGIGVVHRNLGVEEQASEVAKVKKAASWIINEPITIAPNNSVSKAVELMKEFNVNGFPVVQKGKLVGIITNRDWRLLGPQSKALVKDVMTKKVVTAPENISVEKAKRVMHERRIEKLPVVNARGELAGLITFRDIEESEMYPLANKDEKGRLCVAAAVGVNDFQRVKALSEAEVDAVVVDTAHGHSQGVLDTVREIKKRFKGIEVVGGNVVTQEATRALIKAGADAVKVGVGPGSICTTRVVAGVGAPQLGALMECSRAAGSVPVIADGGIRYSGDVAKALAAGASSVMIGALFAGTDETPTRAVFVKGRKYKAYRGMGSVGAMMGGSRGRYFQEHVDERKKLVPEGVEGLVPYRGKVNEVVHQLVGGLKASLGYCGARDLKEFKKKARFVEITRRGLREGHPHDVIITDEAPNYPLEPEP